jgi:hypothetical protein
LRGYSITLYEIKAEPDYVIYMFACPLLDPFEKYLGISIVFRLMICTATANTKVWERKCISGIFILRGRGGEYYEKGRPVSNCREDENMFLSPCMKISLSAGYFLKAGPTSRAGRVEFI